MTRRFWGGGLVLLAVAAVAGADDNATAKASFERLKKLAGQWVAAEGQDALSGQVVSVFKVSAGGSVVEETVFPGAAHEMVTIYYLDGANLVLTHYCAAGNQPHMKADPNSPANRIDFKFAGGTNLDPAKDSHMHEGSITFVDDNHIDWKWVGYQGGKPAADHQVGLKLVRKK